ncbi:MAG: secondary thiamine-phosphate synthase enzyme YjbQ [Nitrococcus sp.]|nr:secondary thiamine-phosphate synthase enzyme YjbQ [Nitrococcus sp.]
MDRDLGNRAMHQQTLELTAPGRGTQEITADVAAVVRESGIDSGLCHLFVHHTSASLIICENADPLVREDLERFAQRLVPDGDPMFKHRQEGADDMAAHVRTVFTQSALSVPVAGGRLALGTWQGVFLWEHRYIAQRRRITISVIGE